MESIYKGIVINKLNYGDSDEIVTILSPSKQLTFIAKGVQKPTSKNRVALQLLNVVECEIFEARLVNKMSRLKTANLIDVFNLQSETDISFNLIKLFNQISDKPYLVVDTYFQLVNEFGKGHDYLVFVYILNQSLHSFGLYPNYKGCVVCHDNKNIVDFEYFEGGFMCVKHAKHSKEIDFLSSIYLLNKDFETYKDNFDKKYLRIVAKMIWAFLQENLYV